MSIDSAMSSIERKTSLRKAMLAIDQQIKTARNQRLSKETNGAVRRLATRRGDVPWWMNEAG
jgi:hypothetical protein